MKVKVYQLKKGDVLTSGGEIISCSAGARTPSGKMDVHLKYPNGKEYTKQWGKHTEVGIKDREKKDDDIKEAINEEVSRIKNMMRQMNEGRWIYVDDDGNETEPEEDLGYDYGEDEMDNDFADPGGNSALRAAGPGNPRKYPCPTCGRPNKLTAKDVQQGYQCDNCADRAEGRYQY